MEEYRAFGTQKTFKQRACVDYDYWDGECDYKNISQINIEYNTSENVYVNSLIFLNRQKIEKEEIKKKYEEAAWINMECIKFYKNLNLQIEELRVKKDGTQLDYALPLAKKVAKYMMEKGNLESVIYRKIFFGVILRSFFSQKNTWIEIKE